jgi:DNA-binding NarL/FixJ family response regulator
MIRIAIADDLPIILEGLKFLLGRISDFSLVAEFKNGRDLVENIESAEPDIVLSDIDMPVMDGIEATKIITSKHPEIKVIALSMHSDTNHYYDMIAAGAKGFVLKQSSTRELEQAIRTVYDGGNYFSGELLHNIIVTLQKNEASLAKKKKDIPELTEKELQFVTLVCQGLTNKELADSLCVSVKTVENYKAKLMEKTGTKNNAGLIIWAIKTKTVDI